MAYELESKHDRKKSSKHKIKPNRNQNRGIRNYDTFMRRKQENKNRRNEKRRKIRKHSNGESRHRDEGDTHGDLASTSSQENLTYKHNDIWNIENLIEEQSELNVNNEHRKNYMNEYREWILEDDKYKYNEYDGHHSETSRNQKPCWKDITTNEIKIMSWNSRGNKCREIAMFMKENDIKIAGIQECKIPTNSKFMINDYIFITSTDIKGGAKKKRSCRTTKSKG